MQPYKRISKGTLGLLVAGALATGGVLGYANLASAQIVTPTSVRPESAHPNKARRGVVGIVSSVNGTALTVTSQNRKAGTTTTYEVDATTAIVKKEGVASSLSDIAVGDKVHIKGTVDGTNITATGISSGSFKGAPHEGHRRAHHLKN